MRLPWAIISMLALASCAPKEISIQLKIITSSCEAKTNPFDGVGYLRVRVTGDGIVAPLEKVAPTGGSSREIAIPQIPAGKNRVVDVRGFDMEPSMGGKVISLGRSLPFDIADVIPDPSDNKPINVTVFLRRVNTFTRPASEGAPTACQNMKLGRAGHTATVLKNGKVFIAGGYSQMDGTTARVSLSETELFNPTTNAFEPSARMAISVGGTNWIPKAFHTATLLSSGNVLLWGGESYTGLTNNNPIPSTVILVFDPEEGSYGAVKNRFDPPAIARTRHQAAIDVNGKVLIVGGDTRTMTPPAPLVPADKVEWFDPKTNDYKVIAALSQPRSGSSAKAVQGGEFIAVAGGGDGTTLANEVLFFKWDTVTLGFKKVAGSSAPRLVEGRRNPALATLRDSSELLVLGGSSDSKIQVPIGSSEIINSTSSLVSMGPSIGSGRAELCAAQLPDGKVIAIGGLVVEGPGPEARSDGSTVIINPNASGGASSIGGPAISIPRYQHTCTALPDGTVLVLGGVNELANGTREILSDAWIYQPAPTTP